MNVVRGSGKDVVNGMGSHRLEGEPFEPRIGMRDWIADAREPHTALAEPPQEDLEDLDALARRLLVRLGEDPSREGLVRTPGRMARALTFLTSGYQADLETLLNGAIFSVEYEETISVKHIELFSLCEHHLLPFFGTVDVTYVPDGRVLGLSKIPRIVDMFARRLQIQERLTNEIADALVTAIAPRGVSVTMEARHCCLMMRGVQKQQASLVTHATRGVLRAHAAASGARTAGRCSADPAACSHVMEVHDGRRV